MHTNRPLPALIRFLLVALLPALACTLPGLSPVATAQPTATLRAASSAPPTASPRLDSWQARVVSARTTSDYGGFTLPADSENRFFVLTIEYRNTGAATAKFSPESVVLVNVTDDTLVGWGKTPTIYREEDSEDVWDFDEESVLFDVEPGYTWTEDFVWEFPGNFTQFLLYFPETRAIEVTVN